ncbi:hypothetical protein [Amycolatopsis sp. cg9]|uniref:hypothetical protein n=1 Tax=Amycolatopsis sp. cg9 TaxID=3238801 RepID=UPI00352632C0
MLSQTSGLLRQLADSMVADNSLSANVQQHEDQVRSAAEMDHRVRAANLTDLLGESGNPLIMVTRTFSAAPHIANWTRGLDATSVASDLTTGRSVAEVALRYGFASIEAATEGQPGFPIEMMTKTLRAELSLPRASAERVAAHFVAAYLLLHFITTAKASFSAVALRDSCAQLAGDDDPVTRLVTALWA